LGGLINRRVTVAASVPYAAVMRLWPVRERVPDVDGADVADARRGDEAAFERLVTRREREVYRVAYGALRDADDALDAVQEVFLRVFRALGTFRGEATFRSWVVGITLNVCRNRLSHSSRRIRARSVPLEVDGDQGEPAALRSLADHGPGPENEALAGELRQALARCLGTLSAEHREVLLLREAHGMEYEEIAAALSCRVGTVKSRLARARSALRFALEGVWP
jgi:RNA polymerase sigma-70 factor (ECF subfamily)